MLFLYLNAVLMLVLIFCDIFVRDIPMPLVSSGVEHGNLRELALARMKDMGTEVRPHLWRWGIKVMAHNISIFLHDHVVLIQRLQVVIFCGINW